MAIINRKVRTYSDLNLLLTSNPSTSDVSKVFDENAIKSSVRNLILTRNYERPFHPEKGCQITSLLFENFTPITKSAMEQTIKDVIDKFEPRARLTDVIVSENPDQNAIDITVRFVINNIDRPIIFTTTLTRAR